MKRTPTINDEHILIRAAKSGDRAACQALFEKYRPLLWKFARKWKAKTTNLEVDDLFQEAWILFDKAIQRFDSSRGVKFITFVYHAMRPIQQVVAKAGLVHSRDFAFPTCALGEFDVPEQFDEEAAEKIADDREVVAELLATLPDRYRRIVRSWMRGEGPKSIARRMGVSRNRISQIILKSRRIIAQTKGVER